MKVKTVKKMNLPELIQYVWEKDDVLGEFTSNCGTTLYTSSLGSIRIEHAHKYIGKEELFAIEVTEELTIFTHLEDMVEVLFDDTVIDYRYTSISDIQGNQTSEIYVAQNGKLHLIWSAESGIPESGVLEVDQNDQTTRTRHTGRTARASTQRERQAAQSAYWEG